MQQIRSILFTGLWAFWTALFAPVLWGVLLLRPRAPVIRVWTRVWARGVLWLLRVVVGLRYEVRGRENIPAQPCLLVANHQATWETIAFLTLFPDVAIITKEELLNVPIFGSFLRLSPMITIDRDSGSKAIRKMVDEGGRALAEGRSILIFPEGTRSQPGAKIEFKRGVELLYARLGCEMLPVAMNSGDFWGMGASSKKAGRIVVSCLPAIPPGMPPQEAIRRAEAVVQSELDAIRQAQGSHCA